MDFMHRVPFFKKIASKASLLRTKLIKPRYVQRFEYASALLPGFFLIGLGFSALFAPELMTALIAGFCFSFGILFCLLAVRVLAFKNKLSKFSSQIEARLIIDPGKTSTDLQNLMSAENHKKEFFH